MRAPTPQDRRARFDRSRLAGILLAEQPSPARRVGAIYGDAVVLAGVDWSPREPRPGDTVEVTYYFRVTGDVDEDYKVFVHVDDREGRADRINADHWPADGRYPTGVWRRNEVVRDTWSFRIPASFKGDALELWTGFYQPGRDDRWPLSNRSDVQNDGQNRVMAASIPVR